MYFRSLSMSRWWSGGHFRTLRRRRAWRAARPSWRTASCLWSRRRGKSRGTSAAWSRLALSARLTYIRTLSMTSQRYLSNHPFTRLIITCVVLPFVVFYCLSVQNKPVTCRTFATKDATDRGGRPSLWSFSRHWRRSSPKRPSTRIRWTTTTPTSRPAWTTSIGSKFFWLCLNNRVQSSSAGHCFIYFVAEYCIVLVCLAGILAGR